MDTHRQKRIADIAKEFFGFETLETRHCDSLDFRELSVWNIQNALDAAFRAGQVSVTKVSQGKRPTSLRNNHLTA